MQQDPKKFWVNSKQVDRLVHPCWPTPTVWRNGAASLKACGHHGQKRPRCPADAASRAMIKDETGRQSFNKEAASDGPAARVHLTTTSVRFFATWERILSRRG